MTKTTLIVIMTIPILIGLALSIPGVKTVIKAKESESWPKAQATIVLSLSGGGGKYADVVYEYYVDKELRSGGRILFGEDRFKDKAYEYLEKYKKGTKVTIYYNPNNPDEAVLEPGIHMTTWVGCGVALVPILLGSLFIFFGVFLCDDQFKKK